MLPREDQRINAITVDHHGSILLGGAIDDQHPTVAEDQPDLLLVRLLADGSPDPAFGQEGVVMAEYSSQDEVDHIAVDSKDRIVVAGTAAGTRPYEVDLAVTRFTPSGQQDASFSGNGQIQLDPSPDLLLSEGVLGLGIAPGDRPVVMEGTQPKDISGELYDVLRFTEAGEVDRSYGSDGRTRLVDSGRSLPL